MTTANEDTYMPAEDLTYPENLHRFIPMQSDDSRCTICNELEGSRYHKQYTWHSKKK